MLDELMKPAAPVVLPELTIISEEGDLPRGMYYYFVTAVDSVGEESSPSHILQVCARHRSNSIVLYWIPETKAKEYNIYRGTEFGKWDGYFTVWGNDGYFQDAGVGILNEKPCPSILK
jgi:hypothetical protein